MELPNLELTRAQEKQCAKMHWWGKLCEANLRESLYYLKKIAKGRFDDGELLSFAYDGLMQAAKNFDPERCRFFTWAKAHVRGKLFAAMRDQTKRSDREWAATPPTHVEDPYTGEQVEHHWVHEPSVDFDHEQLNAKIHFSSEIKRIMERVLKPQELRVVSMRIWRDLRFREIGEELGFSTSRAQAVYERAIRLVRRELMRRKRLNNEEDPDTGSGN